MNAPVKNLQALEPRPLYGIGTVARLTGLKSDTLRVWERRYGLGPATSRRLDDANTPNQISTTCNWCRRW